MIERSVVSLDCGKWTTMSPPLAPRRLRLFSNWEVRLDISVERLAGRRIVAFVCVCVCVGKVDPCNQLVHPFLKKNAFQKIYRPCGKCLLFYSSSKNARCCLYTLPFSLRHLFTAEAVRVFHQILSPRLKWYQTFPNTNRWQAPASADIDHSNLWV